MPTIGQPFSAIGGVARPIDRHAFAPQGPNQAFADHAVVLDQKNAHLLSSSGCLRRKGLDITPPHSMRTRKEHHFIHA